MMKEILLDTWNLLTFRLAPERIEQFTRWHLWFGLACTWLVGMGRYWDDPRAGDMQKLGVGSVGYVFVLSLILWVLGKPFAQRKWTYRHVLTYVSLVSPPALLYAIPVEQFTTLGIARNLNVTFLAVVAIWRVALLIRFYSSYAGMRTGATISATFLPITGIIVFLFIANLQHVVFDIMGGLRDETDTNAHTDAYGFIAALSCVSVLLFPVLFISYHYTLHEWRNRGEEDYTSPG